MANNCNYCDFVSHNRKNSFEEYEQGKKGADMKTNMVRYLKTGAPKFWEKKGLWVIWSNIILELS